VFSKLEHPCINPLADSLFGFRCCASLSASDASKPWARVAPGRDGSGFASIPVMRDPASPEGPKVPEAVTSSGTPCVSIPDRRRIDSDVRAFLREPSTPWIVFDQEGRPPSQLAVGEILRGPRRTLLSDYDFFPATAAVDHASASHSLLADTSLAAVSSDVSANASSSTQLPAHRDSGPPDSSEVAPLSSSFALRAFPMFGVSRRVLGFAAGGVALLSILVVGAVALQAASSASAPSAAVDGASLRTTLAATPATPATPVTPVSADVPPPDLVVKAPQPAVAPVALVAPAPAVAAAPVALTVVTPRVGEASARSGANKYGRLTIAGDARAKDVFMDGKRMLGHGARTFSVMCGAHTIAVSVRSDAHEVEIPCNAELVVGK
jgi:hypothetical protein